MQHETFQSPHSPDSWGFCRQHRPFFRPGQRQRESRLADGRLKIAEGCVTEEIEGLQGQPVAGAIDYSFVRLTTEGERVLAWAQRMLMDYNGLEQS